MNQQKENVVNLYDGFGKEIGIRERGNVSKDDFIKLYEVIEALSSDERQKKTKTSCNIFLKLVKKYIYNKQNIDNPFIDKIIKLIEIIKVNTGLEHDNSDEAFFSFLTRLLRLDNDLKRDNSDDIIQKLLYDYNLFEDIISEVSWLFELTDDNGKLVFPISRLLVFVIDKFEYDNKHLLLLSISLQLFSAIKEMKNNNEKDWISQRVLEIAEQYHIEILKCLCNGGELLYNISHYVHNNLIAVKSNDSIIIRSTNKDYFINSKVYSEKNNNGEEIGYYVISNLGSNEELCSFTEFMINSAPSERLKLLEKVLDEHYYNIFIGKSIIINSNDRTFAGFTNPYCNSDEYILYNRIIRDSKYENFFQILANNVENLRTVVIYGSSCDIVTLDFIIQFYLEVVKKSSAQYISCMRNCPKNDFYQNIIIQNYFHDIITNQTSQYIEDKIECYYQFIKKYLTYNAISPDTLLDNKHKLVLPYSFIIPFGGESGYWDYKKNNLFPQEGENIYLAELKCKQVDWKQSYWIETEDVSTWSFCQLDRRVMDKKPDKDMQVFVDKASQTIYNLEEIKRIGIKLKQLSEICRNSLLTYKSVLSYNKEKIERLCKLINNVGMADCNYKVFGCDMKDNYEVRRSIILYKVLWHFQIMKFDIHKVRSFLKLVLDMHYTKSANDEKTIESYFNDAADEMRKQGHIVIAKETSSNDGTLYAMFIRVRNSANRSSIGNAFDKNGISGISKDSHSGRYLFNGKEIKEICILTDLITKGTATIEMLDYYLNNRKKENCPKRFLELNLNQANNGIYEIVKTNKPKICIKAIFAYESGMNAIKEKMQESYGLKGKPLDAVKLMEKFNIMANQIIPEEYIVNDEIRKIVTDLYGSNYIINNDLCCVFRFVNMPAKTVFPKFVVKTERIVGLFNRREEVG